MTNFNSHASCEAWRQAPCRVFQGYPHFNSHASCEAWPISWYRVFTIFSFQLTRLMRGVTDCFPVRVSVCDISTHTPHARRDWNALAVFLYLTEFQLTRLMRGVTRSSQYYGDSTFHFNSHASCEAWLYSASVSTPASYFNSHASCEAWLRNVLHLSVLVSFQLTRLMRGVTFGILIPTRYPIISTHTPHARRDYRSAFDRVENGISTHTPHARRDPPRWFSELRWCHFNSHASCEAWHEQLTRCETVIKFQLTRLMRGVTYIFVNSILSCIFQLTRLMRGVTYFFNKPLIVIHISTHTPHARRDGIARI